MTQTGGSKRSPCWRLAGWHNCAVWRLQEVNNSRVSTGWVFKAILYFGRSPACRRCTQGQTSPLTRGLTARLLVDAEIGEHEAASGGELRGAGKQDALPVRGSLRVRTQDPVIRSVAAFLRVVAAALKRPAPNVEVAGMCRRWR